MSDLSSKEWVKTSDRLPPRNLPVLVGWRSATAWGATWRFDVAKFGGKRWLDVVPAAANEEFLPPDCWREIEPPEVLEASEAFKHPFGGHPHQVCPCGAKVPTNTYVLHTCGDRLTPKTSQPPECALSVLQSLSSYLGSGGLDCNDPEKLDAKIRAGIDAHIRVALERAAKAIEPAEVTTLYDKDYGTHRDVRQAGTRQLCADTIRGLSLTKGESHG